MKSSFKVNGLRELGLAMKELDGRLQKRIARSATAAGARVVAAEAKRLVPVDEGTVRKNIRTANLKPTQPGLQETAVGVRVKGKTEQSAFYWRFLEFGTAKMPPKPFLRPAIESKQQEAAQRIKEQLSKRLNDEAAKVGREVGRVDKK